MGKNRREKKDYLMKTGNVFIRIFALITYILCFNRITVFEWQDKNELTLCILFIGICYLIYESFSHLYEGFKSGKYTAFEIALAHILAFFFADIAMWGIGSAYRHHLMGIMTILKVFVVQGIIALFWAVIMNSLYIKFNVPNKILAICGENGKAEVAKKIAQYKHRFIIENKFSAEFTDEDTFEKLLEYDGVLLNRVDNPLKDSIVQFCLKNSLRMYFVPDIADLSVKSARMIPLIDTPLFLYDVVEEQEALLNVKRFFDFALSFIALVVLFPIFILVAIAIKIEDKGSVFYTQERYTRGNKRFRIIKFRSMKENADQMQVSPTTNNDPRITRVGKVIRACRIDELPQLINIIKGDMSIVGPRPERTEHVDAYTEQLPSFELRNKMRGGLTGLAQIYGKYNTSPYDKLCLDLMYIENWSLFLDIKIILQTVKVCFIKESSEGFSIDDAEYIQKITSTTRKR